MFNFISKWIAKKAVKIMNSREPDFNIGPQDDPYMKRWWAIPRNHFFNIYIHQILHDDDDRALHDHPWASLSLLCSGMIRETYTYGKYDYDFGQRIDHTRILLKQGSWTYRSKDFAHRLELYNDEPAVTIFITGPRVREWGFLCPNGWRHWKDFVATEDKGSVGVGCGEQEIIPNSDGSIEYPSVHCKECGKKHPKISTFGGYCSSCYEASLKSGNRISNISFWFSIIFVSFILAWLFWIL